MLAGAHELITAVTRIPPTRLKKRTLEEDLDFLKAPPALKKHVLKLAFEDRYAAHVTKEKEKRTTRETGRGRV